MVSGASTALTNSMAAAAAAALVPLPRLLLPLAAPPVPLPPPPPVLPAFPSPCSTTRRCPRATARPSLQQGRQGGAEHDALAVPRRGGSLAGRDINSYLCPHAHAALLSCSPAGPHAGAHAPLLRRRHKRALHGGGAGPFTAPIREAGQSWLPLSPPPNQQSCCLCSGQHPPAHPPARIRGWHHAAAAAWEGRPGWSAAPWPAELKRIRRHRCRRRRWGGAARLDGFGARTDASQYVISPAWHCRSGPWAGWPSKNAGQAADCRAGFLVAWAK